MDNGFCDLHGGKNLAGPLHWRYKDGSRSKYNPKSLMGRYEASLQDPELLSQRHEIAILDARLQKLVERVEEDVDEVVWSKLIELWGEFVMAITAGDTKKQNDYLGRLNRFIDRAEGNLNNWRDIERSMSLRAKLTEAEVKRAQALETTFTTDQVVQLLTTTILALKEIVFKYADPVAARHILTDASVYNRRLLSVKEIDAGDDSR